jgi:hypothetical protein
MATPQVPAIVLEGVENIEFKEMELGPWSFTLESGTNNLLISDAGNTRDLLVNGVQVPDLTPQSGTTQAGLSLGGLVVFVPEFKNNPPVVCAFEPKLGTLLPITSVSQAGFDYPVTNLGYVEAFPSYGGINPILSLTQLATGHTFALKGSSTLVTCWVLGYANITPVPINIRLPYPISSYDGGNPTHVTLSNGKPAIFVPAVHVDNFLYLYVIVGSDTVPNLTTTWTTTTLLTIAAVSSFAGFQSVTLVANPDSSGTWILAASFSNGAAGGCVTMNLDALGTTKSDQTTQVFASTTARMVALGRVPGYNRVLLAALGSSNEGVYLKYTDDMINWWDVNTGSPVLMVGDTSVNFANQMSAINGQVAMLLVSGGTSLGKIATSADGGLNWTEVLLPPDIGGDAKGYDDTLGAVLFEKGSSAGFPAILTALGGFGPTSDRASTYWVSSDNLGTSWSLESLPYAATSNVDIVSARQIFQKGLPTILYYRHNGNNIGMNYPTFDTISWIATPQTH